VALVWYESTLLLLLVTMLLFLTVLVLLPCLLLALRLTSPAGR
jgi:hypothetical protein